MQFVLTAVCTSDDSLYQRSLHPSVQANIAFVSTTATTTTHTNTVASTGSGPPDVPGAVSSPPLPSAPGPPTNAGGMVRQSAVARTHRGHDGRQGGGGSNGSSSHGGGGGGNGSRNIGSHVGSRDNGVAYKVTSPLLQPTGSAMQVNEHVGGGVDPNLAGDARNSSLLGGLVRAAVDENPPNPPPVAVLDVNMNMPVNDVDSMVVRHPHPLQPAAASNNSGQSSMHSNQGVDIGAGVGIAGSLMAGLRDVTKAKHTRGKRV